MSCKINPHIFRYIEMVEQGKIRACEEQHLLVAHIRRCFETEAIYTDADQLEHYLKLARYFPFERVFEWQAFYIGLHDCTYWKDTGMPRWPDGLCLIGRGAGKDGTIALESLCLMSPYNNIRGYDVDICANNEEQAMRPLEDAIEVMEDPENTRKLKRFFYWNKVKIECLKTKSTMKGRTNSPKGKDGLRSGIVIFNEIHQYENYDNINVFTTGLGKKKHPRRSYFTTNGDVRDGPLDDLIHTAEDILRGGEPDNGLLPFICKLNQKKDVHDPRNWEMANPSLPYLPNLMAEIKKEYAEWKKDPQRLPAFMTKRMNIPESKNAISVTSSENIGATNRPIPDLSGWSCVLGIDYTKVTDFASVNAHFRKGDERFDINHSWLCLNSKDIPRIKPDWREWERRKLLTVVDDVEIHPDRIAAYVADLARKYNVLGLALDDYRYALLMNALKQVGFDAADHKNVKLVRPSDIMKIYPVIDSCFANQFFTWGDNTVLRWATSNTKLVPASARAKKAAGDDAGNYVFGKIEQKSRKTDPFMALVHSMVLEPLLGNGGKLATPEIQVYTY